jgi:hypothetical protein
MFIRVRVRVWRLMGYIIENEINNATTRAQGGTPVKVSKTSRQPNDRFGQTIDCVFFFHHKFCQPCNNLR